MTRKRPSSIDRKKAILLVSDVSGDKIIIPTDTSKVFKESTQIFWQENHITAMECLNGSPQVRDLRHELSAPSGDFLRRYIQSTSPFYQDAPPVFLITNSIQEVIAGWATNVHTILFVGETCVHLADHQFDTYEDAFKYCMSPIIYCDGVFDLFHNGHLLHLKEIANRFHPWQLIVGVIGDADATGYKRRPKWTENQRKCVLNSLGFVDQVIVSPPLILSKDFIEEHHIDMVVHAFSDPSDIEKQKDFFSVPINLGIFQAIGYNSGVSTSSIIKNEVCFVPPHSTALEKKQRQKWYHKVKYTPDHSVFEWCFLYNDASVFASETPPNWVRVHHNMKLDQVNTKLIEFNLCHNSCPIKSNSFDHVIIHIHRESPNVFQILDSFQECFYIRTFTIITHGKNDGNTLLVIHKDKSVST